MPSFSPWTVAENVPPAWLPGEQEVSAAFLAVTFYLFFDINVQIFRTFQKRRGLYFWSVEINSWAVMFNAIGIVLRYQVSNSQHLWILYTFLLTMSWTIYSVGQNLVLYSRLHLVSPNYRIQRGILIMILSTLLTVQVPCWIFVWGAYDPDPKISSVWSPRMAIQERYQQLAYTCVETTISGFYIYSLIKLLRLKTSVRQRRVMRDLILVNVIVISFDIVLILLMYLNQLGLSHPIQAFSYMLKLKLEFAVLNQLMAVAARGLRRTNFEEKRYHHSSTEDSMWTVSPHDSGRKPPIFLQHSNSPAEVSKPSVAHLKKGLSFDDQSGYDGPSDPPEINNNSLSEPGQTTNPSEGRYLSISTGSTLENAQHTSRERLPESSEKFPAEEASRIARWIKIMRRRQASAASKKRPARRAPGDLDDDDEDDIGVYMWEHRGSLVLRAPWFGSEDSELHA